ncbi:N-formylglutamate amidohydrolase [Tropicimonas isoalkanivorans]|uniref:N-formylglutamate amidohydrolase n=1 Tax=Tropicimonas isoalkanivorans TaxID=441112 RepID=A0A1I1KS15_9RHOB|nr:N-formylglutamate amidohydrolase [Tropicimonas isoalkanivorans]SFC63624.1 N-formylglutamate amidohydrolase [Tropicimonas isoalkanivorans]
MPTAPYRLDMPRDHATGVIFASPHSGRDYTWEFLRKSVLDEMSIRSSEDAFVDRLFDSAPSLGAPLLSALAPRAYVDLNRGADELDPALVRGVRSSSHNPRVTSGLGVIPRVVANGRAIYNGKLELAEARSRLAEVWKPYHTCLQSLIEEAKSQFGLAVLIDCHSMPHEAVQTMAGPPGRKPHVVLGDRFGAACSPDIMDRVEAAFAAAGLRVVRNAPFAGAYITQYYGRPSRHQHVVQVEIDRGLYMDERRVRPSQEFATFRDVIRGVIAEIVEIGRGEAKPLAAE